MVRGMAVLLLFQFGGELITRSAGWPIPGNVLGMVLLLIALARRWVKVEWIEEAAEFLLENLALFFVPAGVGVMVYFDLIAGEWLAISVATFVSTFVVMAVTGKLADRFEPEDKDVRRAE